MQHISGGDISANSVVATGAIASSLGLNTLVNSSSSRGVTTLSGSLLSTLWQSAIFTPSGEGLKYSTYLVNVQTAIYNNGIAYSDGIVQIDISSSSSLITKSIPYVIQGTSTTIPIFCSFILSDFKGIPFRVISRINAGAGGVSANFIIGNAGPPWYTSTTLNTLNNIDITGLA